jgi:uncharacterized protein YndB with AHSA1/START domain
MRETVRKPAGCRTPECLPFAKEFPMLRIPLRQLQRLVMVVGVSLAPLVAGAQALAPDISVTKVINAPVADVWKAWTTTEGIESFWAPKAAKVEPVPGGAFELWFGVNNKEGSRGSEGCLVHSVTPMEQFVFEWNAPPDVPSVRKLRTLVYIDFKPLPDNRTEVTLRNFGYGAGEDWAKARAYFQNAWPAVMGLLEKRFAPKG